MIVWIPPASSTVVSDSTVEFDLHAILIKYAFLATRLGLTKKADQDQQLQMRKKSFLEKEEKEQTLEQLKRATANQSNTSTVLNFILFDSIELTSKSLARLRENEWLNDDIVSIYMNMLQDRENYLCSKVMSRKCYIFVNTNAIVHLRRDGVRKPFQHLAKGCQINDVGKLFFPINLRESHWFLAVVDLENFTIIAYDSYMLLAGNQAERMRFLNILDNYFSHHLQNLTCEPITWRKDICATMPQQNNGSDCGVYTILAADVLADDLPIEAIADIVKDVGGTREVRINIAASILRGYITY